MRYTAANAPGNALSDDQAFAGLMAKWNAHLYSFAWHYLRDSKLAREAVVRVLVRYHLKVAFLAQQCTPLSLSEIAEILNASNDEAMHLIARARKTIVATVAPPLRATDPECSGSRLASMPT